MRNVGQDLRFALRTLYRVPLVTAVALATLALGIGATTAIFSVIRGVLFDPLSAEDPGEIVLLVGVRESSDFLPLSYDDFRDFQTAATTLEAVAVGRPQSVAVTGGGHRPERIRGLFVSASFFDVLGPKPHLGRFILPGEDVPGGERTAVLSYGFWQRRFGADPGVVGESLRFNNEVHTIVGVMPADFRFPVDTTEAWVSLQTSPGDLDRGSHNMIGVARLADGVTTEEASEEMAVIAGRLAASYPETNEGRGARVMPFTEFSSGDRAELFGILLAAVVMVLLIACANVANLQLARSTGRGREMAVRTALGSSRARLVRQLLTENILLALIAGVLGLAVAEGSLRLLLWIDPGVIGGRFNVDMNLGVLVFAATVALTSGVLFGLAPALGTSRTDLVEGLRESSRGASGGRGGRLRGMLVVAQMALAVILLIGAGLLIRSFTELQRVDVGFERDDLLTVQFRLPANKYETDEAVVAFFDQMIERVGAVPGVTRVVSALGMPFTGDGGQAGILADGREPASEAEVPRLRFNIVSTDYFEGMGIPLLAGRAFSSPDRLAATPVAVVSREASERIWPGEDAVGRTFRRSGDDTLFTVVGVVGDIRNRGLRGDVDPMVYVPYTQVPARFATIGVRVPAEPMSYAPAVRAAIWELDSDQPLWEVMTQNDRIAFWTSSERFTTSLLVTFAAVAMALAAIGIAGVIAYSVGQRQREIGIRLALGARRSQILGLVMGQGAALLAVGLGIGGVGAYFVSRALSNQLFGVAAFDPLSYTLAPAVLGVVALLACYLPARRATRVEPSVTLRYE